MYTSFVVEFLVRCVQDKTGYFAEKIYKSMKVGVGQDDFT